MMMVMVFMVMLFISGVQPMFMISSLIFIILSYSYFIYSMMGGYWFSYALIMVMLSGVMVVFMYMISLLPNESFENYNLVMIVIIMMLMVKEFEVIYLDNKFYFCMNLWCSYVSMYNIFIVSFLLLMMLIVVWFGCMGKGAIRN